MCHCQTNVEVTDRSVPISADWGRIWTLERLACCQSSSRIFFLSFTVKNGFSYRLSTSDRMRQYLKRIWSRKRQTFCCSGLGEAVKLSAEHFPFLLLNTEILPKQLTKYISIEQWLSKSTGFQHNDPLRSLPNQDILKFTQILVWIFLVILIPDPFLPLNTA